MEEEGQVGVVLCVAGLEEDRDHRDPTYGRERLKACEEATERRREVVRRSRECAPEDGWAGEVRCEKCRVEHAPSGTREELIAQFGWRRPLVLVVPSPEKDPEGMDRPGGRDPGRGTPRETRQGGPPRPRPSEGEGGGEGGGAAQERSPAGSGSDSSPFPRARGGSTLSVSIGGLGEGGERGFEAARHNVREVRITAGHALLHRRRDRQVKDGAGRWRRERVRMDRRRGRRKAAAERRARAERLLVLAVLLLVGGGWPGSLSGQAPPPGDRYRSFDTDHFRVVYPEDLRALAERAAEVAESAHATMRSRYFPAPRGRIELLIVDHADLSNGFAGVFPTNRITVWVHPPLDGLALSDFDEWVELVVVHEVAHIFHLDYAGTPGRILRSLFGRAPVGWPWFPGFALPRLAIEGVAVDVETRHSGGGRAAGSLFQATVRSRVLEVGPEPLARALHPSPEWPGGQRPYVYGGLFFHHLGEVYGAEAVAEFLRVSAEQWIPYRLDAAARRVFGRPFTALWSEWMREVQEGATERITGGIDAGGMERLTEGARSALHPAPAPAGMGVAYLRSDGRSDTRLVLRTPEGERTLARWNDPAARPRWGPGGVLYLPDIEFMDRYEVRGDLHRVDPEGRVDRLTHGLRVIHVDPHPGGDGFVAVLSGEGSTRLVLLDAAAREGRTLAGPEPGTLWRYPAWSPTGDRIAVVRRGPDGTEAVLVLDPEGRELHVLAEGVGRHSTPAWGPWGDVLLWGSDPGGVPDLIGVRFVDGDGEPGPLLRVTRVATAVVFPAVDLTGDWIHASVLGADGWDLVRIPYRPDAWLPLDQGGGGAEPVAPVTAATPGREDPGTPPGPGVERADVVDRPYRPLPSLLPRYWLPVYLGSERALGRRFLPAAWGVGSSGSDLIGRHAWAGWVAVRPGHPGDRIEWGGTWAWAGLGNPVLRLETGGENELRAPVLWGSGPLPPDTLVPLVAERFVGGEAEFRRSRVRSGISLTLGGRAIRRDRVLLEPDRSESERLGFVRPSSTLLEGRAGLSVSTVRTHALSISPEAGAAAALFVRERRDRALPDTLRGVPGVDGGLREGLATVRVYRSLGGGGFAHHVGAFRGAVGSARGPGAGPDHFEIGGSLAFLGVRGHPQGVARGENGWSVSAEWRFPLLELDRGFGAWPAWLDRLAGAVFVDAGGTWGRRGAGPSRVAGAGGEVVLSHGLFWEGLQRVAIGGAVPLGGKGGVTGYLRWGWRF